MKEIGILIAKVGADKRWRDMVKKALECPNCSKPLKRKGRDYLGPAFDGLAEQMAEYSARVFA